MDVSVVVPTRNRGAALIGTVRSILQNPGERWELIIVDQSQSFATRDALAESGLLDDPRLRYERVSTTGVSRARNHGLAVARGDVVLLMDDDCIAPDDWIGRTWHQFETDPDLDLFFGGVAIPPTVDGWAYQFRPLHGIEGEVRLSYRYFCEKFGLGSNMAVRRSALAAIGTFDPMLGAGAPFAPAEDTDFGYRALRLGSKIVGASQPAVTHLGVQREGSGAARLQMGIGAMLAKHLRCGDVGLVRVLLWRLYTLLRPGTAGLLRGRRPSGYRTAAYLMLGLIRGLRQPVDIPNRVYRGDRARLNPIPGPALGAQSRVDAAPVRELEQGGERASRYRP